MAPLVTLILVKILDFIAANADDIITEIKAKFVSANEPDVSNALQELGFSPTEENLNKVHDLLVSKGEDPAQLAALLVNKTVA